MMAEKCSQCAGEMRHRYNPMEEWKMGGQICGKCYSERISSHYPGKHVRVNLD